METKAGPAVYAEVASLFGHELSTPLATALLYIGIAENHCSVGNGGVRSALRIARHEVQRLKRLVDALTEFERVGHPILQPQATDLGAIVRATVHRTLATVLEGGSDVTVEVPEPLPGWWDQSAVEQIVSNLLSNALKFGQGRAIRIVVRAAESGATITVRDHGVGVAAGDRLRIFERNTHAPARQGGGLGLGLWLVRELAVAHRGRVEVRSRKGQGAVFTVWLQSLPPSAAGRGASSASRYVVPQRLAPAPERGAAPALRSRRTVARAAVAARVAAPAAAAAARSAAARMY